MVYVLDKDGNPLMPTKRYGKVRHPLKEKKAKPVRRQPFVIQLMYDPGRHKQPVDLGVDAGSKHIGVSAVSGNRELLSAQIDIRGDIRGGLKTRRDARRSRRNRKTRYRKPRFLNRVKSKHKGWIAPSVEAKCAAHVKVIDDIRSFLPVTDITIEMAAFDTQMLKAEMNGDPLPSGEDYQHGESEGYDNIKAYVKWRDGYKCAVCNAKGPLQVHHRQQRKDGGTNTPANLITVCPECHKKYHAGLLPEAKAKKLGPNAKAPKLRDASFMGTMRWKVWNKVKESGIPLHMTCGYKTAEKRREYDLPKGHRIDARCISGHPDAEPADEWFMCQKVRDHNRQLHKRNPNEGGFRQKNQNANMIKGFCLNDTVRFDGHDYFIHGKRSPRKNPETGKMTDSAFTIVDLDGNKTDRAPSRLKLKHHNGHMLIERRNA